MRIRHHALTGINAAARPAFINSMIICRGAANMTLKRIRLELARDHDFPNGSREHYYEFAAPIDDDGYLQPDEWQAERDRCRVKRSWPGEKSEIGHLVRQRGGAWAFDYDPTSSKDDERGFKFGRHRFLTGEYVSIKEHDGVMRTYRVSRVQDLD